MVGTMWFMWREIPGQKIAARALIRAGRRARPPGQRAADGHAISKHLMALQTGMPTGHLAAYTALPTEPPTDPSLLLLRSLGWALMLPVLLADNDLAWDDGALHDVDFISCASLLVVPALAIDRRGRRLGQGGGSYDRALARRAKNSLVVALVYDDELVDEVPSEPHDLGVDAVITPQRGITRFS